MQEVCGERMATVICWQKSSCSGGADASPEGLAALIRHVRAGAA
ncbi:hypothetical protein [Streptomyces sp. NPDC055189]